MKYLSLWNLLILPKGKEIKKIYKWKVKKNIYDILNDIFKWQKNNISNLKKFFK